MRAQRCLILMQLLATVAGCRLSSQDRPPYPHDPLLLAKKPSEEKTTAANTTMLAAAEPVPPAFPAHAFRARPAASLPVQPVATLARPLPAAPASRARAWPTSDAILGHAPDHRWLQGVLYKHYDGHFELRFAAPTAQTPWGGQVRLEDDPRLREFADGARVRVEGNLVSAPAANNVKWGEYPRYRIRTIQLIQPQHLS